MRKMVLSGAVLAVLTLSTNLVQAGPLDERVAAGKSIRVGFSPAAPWAFPGENNEPLGFVNVITLDVLKKMGYTNIEPVVTDWAGMVPSLMADRVDIITGGMYILKSRCESIDFSEPMGRFGDAFIVPDGNPLGLQTYEDVKKSGVVLAAVAGYAMVEGALKAGVPEDKIMQLPGATEVLAAVRSGRASAGALTAIEAYDLAEKTDGIDATDENAMPDSFNWVGVGFRKEDEEFRAAFNAAMAEDYLGSEQMLADVAAYDYLPINVPDSIITTEWACANR